MVVLLLGGVLGFLLWIFSRGSKNNKFRFTGNKPKVGWVHQIDNIDKLDPDKLKWTGKDLVEADLESNILDLQYKHLKTNNTLQDWGFYNPKNGRDLNLRIDIEKEQINSAWNPLNKEDEYDWNGDQRSHLRNAPENYKKSVIEGKPNLSNTFGFRQNSAKARRQLVEEFGPYKKRKDYKDIKKQDLEP